jgi:glycosyltransferase involved in cell wall biosynthesis
MKKITVFTPTYNRAYCLDQLYQSLCTQTSDDFKWLIIDDGSTDGTGHLVKKWMDEERVEIDYHYKVNGGMHTGHNLAYSLINTELNVCIDSDDYMPINAIQLILEKWSNVNLKNRYAGIIGLDALEDGQIVGTKVPDNITNGTLTDLYIKHKVKGDKKIILKTEVVNKYPFYPEFKNEKLVPLDVLYKLIEQDYLFIYVNEIYCIVNYQFDGSSKTIFKQYIQSPRGFAYARKIYIKYSKSKIDSFKAYAHLISAAIFSRDIKIAFREVNPLVTFALFPFGLVLCLFILIKQK